VGLIPLTEGGGIDLNDGVLHESLGTHKLVVRCVVDDIEDTGLAGAHLGAPGKVTGVQAQGAELDVSATATHRADALLPDTGTSHGAAKGMLALLERDGLLTTRVAALMLG